MSALIAIFPEAGQTYKFDWISLIYLAIVIFSVIWGVHKGFIHSFLSFFGAIIAFFIAYLIAKPLGTYLYNLNGWGTGLRDHISSWFVERGAGHPIDAGNDVANAYIITKYGSQNAMEWVVGQAQLTEEVYDGNTVLSLALASLGIPGFLQGTVNNLVLSAVPETASENLAFYFGEAIASLMFVALAFIVIFILVSVIFLIVRILTKNLNKIKVVGPINRILGGVLGLAIGLFYVTLASAGLSALSGIQQVYEFLDSQLCLSDSNVYTVGKMFYNNNFLQILMGYFDNLIGMVRG